MSTVLDKIANPLNYYTTPVEVAFDEELSIEDKVTLLTNWLDDIQLRQTAEAENMPTTHHTRYYAGEVLRLLNKYRTEQAGRTHH